VFLQQSRQPIEHFGAGVSALSFPFWLGAACGVDGAVHIRLSGSAQTGQNRAGCGIAAVKIWCWFGKRPIYEMAKTPVSFGQPPQSLGGRFGGSAILHCFKDRFYSHIFIPKGHLFDQLMAG